MVPTFIVQDRQDSRDRQDTEHAEDHLLATARPAGRWSRGRRESDHFFGAGPRALLFLSLLHQQTQTERTLLKQGLGGDWEGRGALICIFAKHPQRLFP